MRLLSFLVTVAVCAGCTSIERSATDEVMVVKPFGNAVFVPVVESLPHGPEFAVLWGDPDTGPSAILMKLRKGSIPLHLHSSDYHLVVLSGTAKHWGEGQTEAEAEPLGPGSYWFQPGGEVHGDACLTEECLVHIVWLGPRDARLASTE
jgi:mannose-6-phosphate isomerase-like protein (cupin superfamily)